MALDDNDRRRMSVVSTAIAAGLGAGASAAKAVIARASALVKSAAAPAGRSAAVVAPRARALGAGIGRVWDRMEPWLERQPLGRWISKTIGRRILVANLFGFMILFCGLMVLSQMNRWLVDAKTDSLTTQARMIAAAIAANAKVETGRLTLDPARLDDQGTPRPTFGEDTFADIRLAIAPEQVAPVLARLIPYGDVRARIYGPDGFQILDTNQRLQRGQISRSPATTGSAQPYPEEKLRSAWTRFVAFFSREGLSVYREVPGERGIVYPELQRALEGQTAQMLLVTADGLQSVAVAQPILAQGGGQVRGAILLSSRPGDLDEVLSRQRRAMLVLSLIALVTSLVSAWLLHRTIAGPMRRLSEAAEHVSQSINKQDELPNFPNRRDEVAALATAFKGMTASLYRRIEASDRFAQDVAHELKNPVAAARSTAEALVYAKSDAQREEMARQIEGEMKRLNRLITDIAKASRLEGELALQETEPMDFAGLTRSVAEALHGINNDNGRSVEMTSVIADKLAYMVDGHDMRLGQVMTNLIDNALSFSAPGGVVRVAVRRDGDVITATVDDDGPGIPEDRLEHVFRRFYSDRPQSDRAKGKNSGLGLSISMDIIRAHGGKMWAENRMATPGEKVGEHDEPELKERRIAGVAGARFTVQLPAMATPLARRA
jgi:two-component system, OmpR family, sensor histidine kinase ChvG